MTLPENFAPTENMKKSLEVLQDARFELSVTDLCKEVGITRQAWYAYFDNPNFMAWYQAAVDRYFALQVSRLNAAATGRALGRSDRGSTADTKLMLERWDKGYAPKSRREQTGADGTPMKVYVQVEVERVVKGDKEDKDGV